MLQPLAHCKGALAFAVGARQAGHVLLHVGIVYACGLSAAAPDLGRSLQQRLNRLPAFVQAVRKCCHFPDFLVSEREPAAQFGVKFGFQVEINRAMQQRATRRNP